MVERFSLGTREDDPDFIYVNNPSPMSNLETRKWFEEVWGKENVQTYALGGMFGGLCNSFKFKKVDIEVIKQKIGIHLDMDEEGYYVRKEALATANQI